MAQINVDPDDLDRFVKELTRFNAELKTNLSRLRSQYRQLSETWKDDQYQRFASDFNKTVRTLDHFVKSSDEHIPKLKKTVDIARELQRSQR